MQLRNYETARGRKAGVVILDPLDGIVYRRARSGRLLEAPSLQELFDQKGREALRRFAGLQYQGFAVGVVA